MSAVGSRTGSVVHSLVGSKPGEIALPAGFPWAPSWGIGGGPGRGYRPGLDPAALVPTPDIELWVTTTGNDSNAGTSVGAAKRSLFGAWTLLSAGTYDNARIYVEAGDYYNDQGWKAVTLGVSSASPPEVTSLEIIGYGGRVRLLAQDAALTYSSAGSGAYSATLAAAPFGVIDEATPDAYGAPTWLTAQASLAAVQASGGWYHSAGTLYVKTADARAPDRWIVAAKTGLGGMNVNNTGCSAFQRGIDWIGFATGFSGYKASRIGAEDCCYRGNQTQGTSCTTITDAYFFRCTADASYNGDGFVYSSSGVALEVDCVGNSNGYSGAHTSNGSTAHGATVIRCGGRYQNNEGPNVADVVSSKSVTLGAMIGASRATAGTQRTNVASDGATGKMYLADCYLDGLGTQDLWTIGAGSVIYLRATGYNGAIGTGTVSTW